MLHRATLPLFAVLLAIFSGSCTTKTPTLNLLVWEGYADPSYVKAFEEANHCKVTASYMGSSDELVAKLRGGSSGNYDVISPSSDVATMIATSGLAAPLDLGRLPSYSQLSPQLTTLSLVRAKGDVYGVPFVWGPDPMIYDTTAFPRPPDSWNVMWDPKLKGKVSVWDDLSTVYMAAQVLGYDKPDSSHIYNLSDEELDAVKKKLVN
jgi:spermidine/putrescine-binding protein